MTTTLAKTLNWEGLPEELSPTIHDLVKSASKVIAPLGPISKFAARSPWVGLEQQTFEQTARRFKEICDIELFPNDSVIQSARDQGEIELNFLEEGLQQWIDKHSFELPRKVVEHFCRAALTQGDLPSKLLELPEVKRLGKKFSGFKLKLKEKQLVKPHSQRFEELGGDWALRDLNRHMIKWCKLFLDESQAVWSMPNREEGFYRAWRKMAPYDPDLSAETRRQIKSLPEEADTALKEALSKLGILHSENQEYLEAHLLALPGWAGMMLWRTQQQINESSLLTDYLAVRISMEQILIKPYFPFPKQRTEEDHHIESLMAAWLHWGGFPIHAWSQLPLVEQKARLTLAWQFDHVIRSRLWLEAWEKTYEDQLMKKIILKQNTSNQKKPVLAQFVFCIDVRSEPFRGKLESAGSFETYGAAGFFGLPIETSKLGNNHSHSSLPVMLKPQFKVSEYLPEYQYKKFSQRMQAVNSLKDTFKTMKHNLLASLLLPEISGPWLSLQTLMRSFLPRSTGPIFKKLHEAWTQKLDVELTLDRIHPSKTELPVGFSEEEKVHYVEQALKTIGLTDHFAPLVVICGHGSCSTNNPYASSLDCGACGGTSSSFNARVLATLCNLPNVRHLLKEGGISIPSDTIFVAAEHITTLDELHWVYLPQLSSKAEVAFRRIQTILPKVSEEAIAERLPKLPNLKVTYKNTKAEAVRLSEDWSEVRPEWGLANNAAFVIGDRKLTQECNLEGRVFLQNYNWKKDKSGSLLANLIAGPATVCQWINLQYYASTVAPHYFGSGNKITQTVTAGIGVMQGNASDLLTGLPWQSVMQSDQKVYHAPLRLLVVIQAPTEYVERLLNQDRTFRQKVQNGWLRLACIDPEGNWKRWS
ncbi:MAG: Na-translocating system protein MpsB [Bacillota bacterium]|nr:Na-translocating system protein MpsB [Bacillota bacterium]